MSSVVLCFRVRGGVDAPFDKLEANGVWGSPPFGRLRANGRVGEPDHHTGRAEPFGAASANSHSTNQPVLCAAQERTPPWFAGSLVALCALSARDGRAQMGTKVVRRNLTRPGCVPDSLNSHFPIQVLFRLDTIAHIRSAKVSTPLTAPTRPSRSTPWTANNSWPKSAKPT